MIAYIFQIRYISNTMFYNNIVYVLNPLINIVIKIIFEKIFSGGARPVRPL